MVEKDMEKAQRLNEVYKYVFAHFDIKSQKDFADYLQVQRTGLSAAMNGAKANLTKNLFTKICAAFPGVFNLDYLLNGTGKLLIKEEELHCNGTDEINKSFDQYFVLSEVIAEKEKRLKEKDEMIADLRSSLSDKNELIKMLKAKVSELQRIINASQSLDWKFPIGVLEDPNESVSPTQK